MHLGAHSQDPTSPSQLQQHILHMLERINSCTPPLEVPYAFTKCSSHSPSAWECFLRADSDFWYMKTLFDTWQHFLMHDNAFWFLPTLVESRQCFLMISDINFWFLVTLSMIQCIHDLSSFLQMIPPKKGAFSLSHQSNVKGSRSRTPQPTQLTVTSTSHQLLYTLFLLSFLTHNKWK